VSASAITLRFGVKAPAGIYCVSVSSGTSDRSYVAEYIIAAGEANTDVVRTITIPGDTASGAYPNSNAAGLRIRWALACGSGSQRAPTANAWAAGFQVATVNQINFFATAGNVFELFDVGLYAGSTAPAYAVPEYLTELKQCQRYYWKSTPQPPTAYLYIYGSTYTAGQPVAAPISFPETMRATPTTSIFGTWTIGNLTGQPSCSLASPDGCVLYATSAGAGACYTYPADATCFVKADARM
jgi:hypothetical protein